MTIPSAEHPTGFRKGPIAYDDGWKKEFKTKKYYIGLVAF
jgi:hypothetical protein